MAQILILAPSGRKLAHFWANLLFFPDSENVTFLDMFSYGFFLKILDEVQLIKGLTE